MKRTISPTLAPKRPAAGVTREGSAALGILGLGMLHATTGSPHLALLGAVGAAVLGVSAYTRRPRWGRVAALCTVGAIMSLAVVSLLPTAAHAQFLQGAEQFFEATFDDAGEAITTVFGGLRGLYLIYLFISFIGVFNAVRQDEDWQAAARTPIIVVISVTVVDVLTQLVVGGGGGGGGAVT